MYLQDKIREKAVATDCFPLHGHPQVAQLRVGPGAAQRVEGGRPVPWYWHRSLYVEAVSVSLLARSGSNHGKLLAELARKRLLGQSWHGHARSSSGMSRNGVG